MSRVGKLPVTIPSGVNITLDSDNIVVKGAKGELSMFTSKEVDIVQQDGTIIVSPANKTKKSRAMWGTMRSCIQNMVQGVTEGFSKSLDIKGVGYRASISGNILTLALGYSHDIKFVIPDDIKVVVDKQTNIVISGINIQKVGQIAAELRALRKPEPYKGKGVRYSDEYVRIKEGKKK